MDLRRARPNAKGEDEAAGRGRRRRGSGSASFDSDVVDEGLLRSQIEAWVNDERPPIGQVLLDNEVIEADDLTDALRRQLELGERLGTVLERMGKVNERDIAEAVAVQFDLPVANLREEYPEQPALDAVGEDLARKHRVLPLRVDEQERVWLATSDPLDTDAIHDLALHCRRIGLVVGARNDINRLIDQSFNVLRAADVHIQAFELADIGEGQEESDVADLTVDDNAPIVQVANRIITQGVRSRASDIHIEPHESGLRVRFRIDGALSEAIQLPGRMGPALTSRLKVMADLNIVERRRPQDGQFSVLVDGRQVDIRISTVATVHGEKTVLRLLDKSTSLISLHDLGMPDALIPSYLTIVKAPLGMLLCTGPTGSGKTTTLYATLAEVNDDERNVVTIEDPVEYQFDRVNQMQVSEAAGITFADGLRGILRQDPDVILVGEIRDVDTARIATQASLTGHFVLSSLHAVDSASALHRFTDMGIEPFLVASAINGVIGQRLMRRICRACRAEYTPPPELRELVIANGDGEPERWTKGTGCNLCSHTGYQGRVGVYELLEVSDAIRDLVVARATAKDIRRVAIDEGMRTMLQEACRLVIDGITTAEDVIRSVYAPGMDMEGASDAEHEHAPLGGPAAAPARNGTTNGAANGHAPAPAAPAAPIPAGEVR